MLLVASALGPGLGEVRESRAQAQSPDSTASAVNLLRESHDLAQQFALPLRTSLLERQAGTAAQIQPDLGREWANELFTLSLQAKENQRASMQRSALKILVRVDPDRALQMLDSLRAEEPDSRTLTSSKLDLAVQVFPAMVERDGISALPVVGREAGLMGAQGNYPYAALGYAAMQATSKDWGHDNQHAIEMLESVFGPAFARYRQNAHGLTDDIEFGKMLQVLAGGLPIDTVKPALHALVENLLAVDTSKYHFETKVYTNDGETGKADNAVDATILFFGTLINRDPELAQQLESTRPALRPALEYAKFGRQRLMMFGGQRQTQNSLRPDFAEESTDAIRFSHINAEAAIAKAEQLPDGAKRTGTILQIAREIAGDHPERAGELIAEAQRGNKNEGGRMGLDLQPMDQPWQP